MLKQINFSELPLPLVQVSPPDPIATNEILKEAYELGFFTNSGVLSLRAAAILANHVNSEFSGYLCGNNTLGLACCFLAIGVRNKYVVVSNFTFAATIQAVILAGGIPLVCDVDKTTLELSKESIIEVIEKHKSKIAVVCPTRVFGMNNDFSPLTTYCREVGIPVVVDAAAALPGKEGLWKFREAAKYEVFSLHATKVFGIGEAGLVVGSSDDIEHIRSRANFGFGKDPQNGFTDGLNAKADEFTAARVITRFASYESDVSARVEFAQQYDDFFRKKSAVTLFPFNPVGTYGLFPIRFNLEGDLLTFIRLTKHIISTRRYYYPTLSEGYRGSARIEFASDLSVSKNSARTTLCLPVYTSYSSDVVPRILELFTRVLGGI
jgi:dTDP-4-amino-4,6-dideoxygalactose transaminase